MSGFAEWLRQRRKALDLTQAELARLVGCSTVLIAKLEGGERRPSKQIAALIAERLELPAAARELFVEFARGLAPAPALGPDLPPAAPPALAEPPLPATRLVGRAAELGRIADLLASPQRRLISLIGPGGAGKTRLAIEAARRARPRPAAFVPLSPVESPDMVAGAVAAALGLPAGADQAGAVIAHLRSRDLILLLDNLEHLLADDWSADPVSDLIAGIIAEAPAVHILATSRERLNLSGEWVIGLDGLSAADASAAVDLFVESAARSRADFQPDPETYRVIEQICAAVGGLPLAIELAAAWVETLSPAEIAAELSRTPDILTSQARDLPSRHRSMRAVFEQSWRMLSADEQGALARLSLFRAGFTREAAAYVGRAGLPLLAALLQKSLLRRTADGRYDLHPLVRLFSHERLGGMRGAADAVHRRYVDYHLALAAQGHEELFGADPAAWAALLAQEHDNLRAALDLAWRERSPAGARLCVGLLRFWKIRGYYREGLAWVERFLSLVGLPDDLRARLLEGASRLAGTLDDWPRARALAEQALALRRSDPDPASLANALLVLGEAAEELLDFAAARAYLEECVAICRELGDAHTLAAATNALAQVLHDLGDSAGSHRLHREVLAAAAARDDSYWSAVARCNLGLMALIEGRPEGERDCALSLETMIRIGNRSGVAFCLAGLAAAAGMRGNPQLGAQLFGASDALLEAIQMPISPTNQPYFARLAELARADSDPAAFAAARAAGRALPAEVACALALGQS